MRSVRAWDLASTKPTPKNRDPDWTAGVLMGLHEGEFYVLDCRRAQDTPGSIEKLLVAVMQHDDAWLRRPVPVRVEQEGGASGAFSIEGMRTRLFVGRDFDGVHSNVSKYDRARPISLAAQHAHVHLLDGPWVDEYLDELEIFPPSAGEGHDDQVDATSLAWWCLTAGGLADGPVIQPDAHERENPYGQAQWGAI